MAFAVLLVMVAHGHADWFQREPFGTFYDVQAESLLDGHWDVPANEMFIEGFTRDGKTYQYFGVWPALLRMPVLAVADGLSGRLTQASLLLGAIVALVGVTALQWRIRQLIRPDAEASRAEIALFGIVTFVFACGTPVVFLTARAWVYHEAVMWSIAWTLLAFERVLAWTVAPSWKRLAAASASATLAFASRPSAALGPVIAMGLLGIVELVRIVRRDGRAADAWRRIGVLAAAAAVPVVAYAGVNYIRFRQLASAPWYQQGLTKIDARHREILDANNGSYFNIEFGPSTVLHYLRPDAIAPSSLFPWLSFPRFRTTVIGNVMFDTLDPASSVPASMPAIALLAVIGIIALVRPSFEVPRAATALRVALIGAIVACAPVVFIGFVTQRYLGDFVPLLALTGLLGLQLLLRMRREPRRRSLATGLLAATAVLAVFGIWANLSLSILYQRLYNPTEPGIRQAMLAFQYDVDRRMPGHPHRLQRADRLPREVADADTTLIVGDCAAVYWSDGRSWVPIEGTPAGGWYRFTVAPGAAREAEPILVWPDRAVTVRRSGDRVHVALEQDGRPTAEASAAVGDGRFRLEVRADRSRDHLQINTDGLVILDVSDADVPAGAPEVVDAPGIREIAPHLLVCPAIDA